MSAFAGATAIYQNVSTFACAIDEYGVDKAGALTGPVERGAAGKGIRC